MTRDELEKKVYAVVNTSCCAATGRGNICLKCRKDTEQIMSFFDKYLEEIPKAKTVRRSNYWDWER